MNVKDRREEKLMNELLNERTDKFNDCFLIMWASGPAMIEQEYVLTYKQLMILQFHKMCGNQ